MLTARECQDPGSSVSQPPQRLCLPEVTSLQACAFPHHISPAPAPQLSYTTAFPSFSPCNRLSKSQTSPWKMPVQPGLLRLDVSFLDCSPQPWAALLGFSSSLGTSSAQLIAWKGASFPFPWLLCLPSHHPCSHMQAPTSCPACPTCP